MLKKQSIVLSMVLLVCFIANPAAALADQEFDEILTYDTVQPMWTYVNSFANAFDISGFGQAKVLCQVVAFDVDQITIRLNLQQFKDDKWSTIQSWSASSETISCELVKYWYVPKGYSYRVINTGVVYLNGRMAELVSYTSPVRVY